MNGSEDITEHTSVCISEVWKKIDIFLCVPKSLPDAVIARERFEHFQLSILCKVLLVCIRGCPGKAGHITKTLVGFH